MDTDLAPKAALRSAESDRVASCKLADRIAKVSIDAFRRHCPEYLSSSIKQTVVAAVVAQITISESTNDNFDDDGSKLIVLSLGQGTKVLSFQQIVDGRQQSLKDGQGDRLIRDCHAEVLARRGLLAYMYDVLESSANSSIFEMTDKSRLRLKSGVKLHLYTSSQPCGNATMKKWAKSSKPVQYSDLAADEVPVDVHSRIQINSRSMGQVAVLVKKNNHLPASNEAIAESLVSRQYEYPVGTAPTDRGEGNVMTCSDKIAKWNALGLQGSLLSQYFEPIYLSSITVGRKFSKVHCDRALCCRLQGFCFPCAEGGTSQSKKMKQEDASAEKAHVLASKYVLHHPVMMSTSVKLDEGAIITGGEVSADTSVGAQFADNRSFCMWRNAAGDQWTQEVVDGKTGLLYQDSEVGEEKEKCRTESQLSSYSLGLRYQKLMNTSRSYQDCKLHHEESNTELSEYTQARNLLITHKDYFAEWIRKL